MRGQFPTINLRQRYQPGNQITHRIQKIENREEWRALPPGRGAVVQSVERLTPGEEVPCSIPAVAARSLLVESVSV